MGEKKSERKRLVIHLAVMMASLLQKDALMAPHLAYQTTKGS